MRLPGGDQALVHGNELRVPAEGGRQGGGIEAGAQPLAAAVNVALAVVRAAVIVIGRKARESGGLLAAQAADLGHADHNGDGSPLANAIDAGDQIESRGEVAVLADGGGEGLEFGVEHRLQAGDLGAPEVAQALIAAGLAARLVAGDVLADLLDDGEMIGEPQQARIGRRVNSFDRRRAGGDQPRIDLVVLGALPAKFCKGTHLRRLEHDDPEAVATQRQDNLALIATARLDADPLSAVLPQESRQGGMALWRVIGGERLSTPINGDIEPALTGINAGANYAILAHLRRTLPLMRTQSSFNHAGQMKSRSRSGYQSSPSTAAEGIDPTIGGLAREAARAGPFLAERSHISGARFSKGRA